MLARQNATVPSRPVPRRRVGAAFVVPLVALFWAGQVQDDAATGANLLVVAVTCGAGGAAWQLLHRRDLADRLTHFASAFTVVTLFVFTVAWHAPLTSSFGFGVGLAGVLTGLVYAEQWLRWREWRAARARVRAGDRVGTPVG